jgi:hypothetical protein
VTDTLGKPEATIFEITAERIRREGEAVCGDREPTAADYSALIYIQRFMRLPQNPKTQIGRAPV